MIKHIFEISITGTRINGTVLFKNISDRYRNTEMIQLPNGNLQLIITKRITRKIDTSIEEAMREANDLVDRLSLLDNHFITSLDYKGYLEGENNLKNPKEKVEYSATWIFELEDPNQYYGNEEIKRILNKVDNIGVLRIYRTTLSIKDKISQYLIFYGLLLILKGEKQKNVDDFIKNEISDILIIPGNNGKNETIITRIRNMIAHPSNERDMTQLNEYVNSYLEILQKLVLNELKK